MNKLIIIGAGLCGATIAKNLHEKNPALFQIDLLEKSRGVGGRLAHRRLELAGADGQWLAAGFNHGCEFLPETADDSPDWQTLVDTDGRLQVPATTICKSLLAGLAVQKNVQAHNLKAASAHSLQDQEGRTWEFDQLVVTSPAPQALQLLAAFLTEAEKSLLLPVIYEKILICFYRDPADARAPLKMCKASAEWSDIHFEASTEEIKKAFQREFFPAVPLQNLLEIKKWRFSQTAAALTQDFLRLEKYPWMWMAGDAFSAPAGPGLLRAQRSGLAIAAALAPSVRT